MKIRPVFTAVFAVMLTPLALHAAPAVNPNGPYDLSHVVNVAIGRTVVQPGDQIVIDAIHGTSDKIAAGNVYRVDGHYTLKSKETANVAVCVTNVDMKSHPAIKNDSVTIARGDGTFTVYFYMWHDGDPYINFYSSNKTDSFDGVYFNGKDDWAR